MNTLSAPSFDLDLAIDLSRRLARLEREVRLPVPSGEAMEYVAFDLSQFGDSLVEVPNETPLISSGTEAGGPVFRERAPLMEQAVESSAISPELRNVKFDSWEQCIMWCNQVTGAAASFVIDSQGFIIANYGRIPPDGLDGIGAELCYAIEMLNKISPGFGKVAWVDLDYDNSRIVGFQVKEEAGETFILGFLSPNTSYFSQKITISRIVSASLPNIM